MIRKQVENLRGLVFTMEEMCDIIIPIIETSLCMLLIRNTTKTTIQKTVRK